MQSFIHSLVRAGAVVLTIVGARLDGQTSPASLASARLQPGIDSSAGELSPAVRVFVGRGDAFTAQLRHAAGEQAYRQAISTAHGQGHLASLTSWRLACAYYFEGRPEQAARVLDELAAEAATFGDLGVEARALFNAGWLYGEGNKTGEATARIARVQKLLRSPYMPLAVRDLLMERLAAPTVAAKR